jgi:hypothetical protein
VFQWNLRSPSAWRPFIEKDSNIHVSVGHFAQPAAGIRQQESFKTLVLPLFAALVGHGANGVDAMA